MSVLGMLLVFPVVCAERGEGTCVLPFFFFFIRL